MEQIILSYTDGRNGNQKKKNNLLKLYKHVIYNYVVKTIFYGKSKTEPVFQSFIHLYNTWKCVNNHRLNFTDSQPHNQ